MNDLVNPDEMQTLPMDFSPVVRTFYGAPVEKKFEPEFQRASTKDSITATTRHLDSFAEVVDPEPPQEKNDQEPEEKEDQEPEGNDDSCKRNLNSVFDEEARDSKISLLGQPMVFTCLTLFEN